MSTGKYGEYDDATGGARGESAAADDRGDAGAVAGGGGTGAQGNLHAFAVALGEQDYIGDLVIVGA